MAADRLRRRALLATGELVARRDVCGRLPSGYDDLLVRRLDQVEVGRVSGLRLSVDPPAEIAAVAADAVRVQPDRPLAEELAKRVRPVLCRLDVNDAIRGVRVELGEEPA